MRIIVNIFDAFTVLCSGVAFMTLIGAIMENPLAPALGAAAASCVALSVIPYCTARAIRSIFLNN